MNIPRLFQKYNSEIIPQMMADFKYSSVMAVPRVSKITVNIGTGKLVKDDKALAKIEEDVATLTGQKPSARKAKQSIAGFKLREGSKVGVAVTLRGKRMYDFMDRLISIALPRTRDFHGLNPKSFDRQGNFSLGIKENNIFPEIHYETLKDIFGLEVTVTTTAHTREEGLALLKHLGFPLRD